jgi:hypothetical protein
LFILVLEAMKCKRILRENFPLEFHPEKEFSSSIIRASTSNQCRLGERAKRKTTRPPDPGRDERQRGTDQSR